MEVSGELCAGGFITGNKTLVTDRMRVWVGLRTSLYTVLAKKRKFLPVYGNRSLVVQLTTLVTNRLVSHQYHLNVVLRLHHNSFVGLFSSCVVSAGRVCKALLCNSVTGVGNFAAVSVWVWSAWLIIRETLISPSSSSCLHYFGYRSTLRHFWFVLVC